MIRGARAIYCLLADVAPKIPVRLDTVDRRVIVRRKVQQCCISRKSLVAEKGDKIIGFLLAADAARAATERAHSFGSLAPA